MRLERSSTRRCTRTNVAARDQATMQGHTPGCACWMTPHDVASIAFPIRVRVHLPCRFEKHKPHNNARHTQTSTPDNTHGYILGTKSQSHTRVQHAGTVVNASATECVHSAASRLLGWRHGGYTGVAHPVEVRINSLLLQLTLFHLVWVSEGHRAVHDRSSAPQLWRQRAACVVLCVVC